MLDALITNVLQISFKLECFSYICAYDEKCALENMYSLADSMVLYEYHRFRCAYLYGFSAFVRDLFHQWNGM